LAHECMQLGDFGKELACGFRKVPKNSKSR
jgi:hypothetical protein